MFSHNSGLNQVHTPSKLFTRCMPLPRGKLTRQDIHPGNLCMVRVSIFKHAISTSTPRASHSYRCTCETFELPFEKRNKGENLNLGYEYRELFQIHPSRKAYTF